MFIDWIHWLSSVRPDEFLLLITPLLLLDVPRYSLGVALVWLHDFWGDVTRPSPELTHAPSVCVVVAGLNEADGLAETLETLWGTYPKLELIVVDDGSDDDMTNVARRFATDKSGVTVLRKPLRGGKSSALNFALPFATAEIIVCVDGDSQLSQHAIWEIVQPFADDSVAAVSGAVLARNPFVNLVTWMQGLEYLRSIFLGRMFASRMGILGIVSGAFGAYRRDVMTRLSGWDVGPGEDGDLALRIRKLGYRIVFAPYAQCLTDLPTTWKQLVKQRRRWDWAIVTLESRKHIDLVDPRQANFRWDNLLLVLDRWVFGILAHVALCVYLLYLCAFPPANLGFVLVFQYACFVLLELVQLGLITYYSTDRNRDLWIGAVFPLIPFYYLFMRCVTFYAVIEEMITRRSYRDNFVPQHVRKVTWHW